MEGTASRRFGERLDIFSPATRNTCVQNARVAMRRYQQKTEAASHGSLQHKLRRTQPTSGGLANMRSQDDSGSAKPHQPQLPLTDATPNTADTPAALPLAAFADTVLAPIHPLWREALHPVEADLRHVLEKTHDAYSRPAGILPAPHQIFRCLNQPPEHTRVLIVGQDPYPNPGHPVGRAFAVANDVRPLPRSLTNIFKELADDIGTPDLPPPDLASWADQGVMLLNEVLTVQPNERASHVDFGWQKITHHIVQSLADRPTPPVAILWGKNAQRLAPYLPSHTTICTPHPSPLSARRGFFGSKPFTRCNDLLAESGSQPVKWHFLPVGSG